MSDNFPSRKDLLKLIRKNVTMKNYLELLNNQFAGLFQHKAIIKPQGDSALTITFSDDDGYNQYGQELLKILTSIFPKIAPFRILRCMGHHSVIYYYVF